LIQKQRLSCDIHLFLGGFDGSLGDLAGTLVGLDDRLDDTDSDGLTHVTDGETSKGRVLGEGLHTHGLGRNHLDDGSVTRLDKLGVVFNRLAGTAVNLLQQLRELASNVSSVAVEHRCVSGTDLARVVEDDDLGVEGVAALGGVILGVAGDVATTDFLDGNVLDVEADVVTRETLNKLFVVHFDGLDFSSHASGGKGNDHAGLDSTGLDTADGYSSDTTDLVNILERQAEGLVRRTRRRVNGVDGLEQGLASGLRFGLLLPSLVPGAVAGGINHVVTVEARNGHEGNVLGVEADLLDEVGSLLDDFLVTGLRPLGGVHLVDGNDELAHTKGEGEQGVLTSLAILGDTSFELTSTGSNDENGAVSLRGTSDHVLDEVTVTGGINDGDIVLGSLELPEGNVDGDTTLTLGLELVKHPRVLEGTLSEFGSFLLELLNGTLVNTTALVDQVSGGGRLAGVDVADNDDVDVRLVLSFSN